MRCLIVGQAKAGTTPVFSLIFNALGEPAGYLDEPIASIPPLPPAAVVRVVLGNQPIAPLLSFAANFDRRIAVLRDPRDRLVSVLLSGTGTSSEFPEHDGFIGDFVRLVEEKLANPGGTTLERILSFREKTTPGFTERLIASLSQDADLLDALDGGWFVFRYEDLARRAFAPLSQHLGIPLDGGRAVGPGLDHVARTRVAGGWRNWFTPSDIERYRALLDPVLVRLGYPADWDLPARASIRPEHGAAMLIQADRPGRASPVLPAAADAPRVPAPQPAPTGLELFQEEARASRAADIPIRLWWRDDDLVANSANFDALIDLARNFAAPVLVAIIPGLASEGLDIRNTDPNLVHFCQHGWRHLNHRPAGTGKSEFGADRDAAAVTAEIAAGQTILARLLGDRRLPVFVPPWNDFDSRHLEILQSRGFVGLSTHGPRPQTFAVDGVRLANTHVDILRWDAPGRPLALDIGDVFGRLARLVREQRMASTTDPEPIGLLSHHRAMGKDAWALLGSIFAAVGDIQGVSWVSPPRVFASVG